MYFRSTQHARNLYISNESKGYLGDMDIYLGGPGEISVKLRNATVEERKIEKPSGTRSPKLFCYATSRREPDDAVHAMFKSVSRGELPKGGVVPKDEEWIYYGLLNPTWDLEQNLPHHCQPLSCNRKHLPSCVGCLPSLKTSSVMYRMNFMKLSDGLLALFAGGALSRDHTTRCLPQTLSGRLMGRRGRASKTMGRAV